MALGGMTVGDLVAYLGLDDTEFNRKTDAAEGRFERLSGRLTSIGTKMTAGVTLPLLGVGAVAVNAASDLAESTSKAQVVFGKASTAVLDWAKNSATAFGMSRQQAIEAAGTFGNLFVAMDMGKPKAAEMSTSLIELAGDLASFNNQDPAEVLEKLRAGLVGETEPLRSLGVNLSEATIQAEAFRLGLAKADVDMVQVQSAQASLAVAQEKLNAVMKDGNATDAQRAAARAAVARAEQNVQKALSGSKVELTAAQKAEAAYSLIMQQTKTAQGDFARTSDGAANKTRIMKAELADASANLGTLLLPAATKGIGILAGLAGAVAKLDGPLKYLVVGLAGAAAVAGPAMIGLGAVIRAGSQIAPVFSTAYGVLKNGAPFTAARGAVSGFASGLKDGLTSAASFAKNLVVATARLVAHTAATVASRTASIAASVAAKAWAAAQWLLNVAMSANPIGLVVAAVAAMVAIFVVAWKKSETFRNIMTGAWNAIKNATRAVFDWIVGFFRRWGVLILRVLIGPIGNLVLYVVQNWNKIKQGAVTAFGAVVEFVRGLPGKIKNAVGSGAEVLYDFGADILRGVWNGMKSIAGWLKDKILGFFKDLLPGWARKALGISSPSKVFAAIGRQTAAGLVLGMDSSRGLVAAATERLLAATALPEPVSLSFGPRPALAVAAAPAAVSGMSVVVQPGAVQVSVSVGDHARTADVRAAVQTGAERALAGLARELRARGRRPQ